MSDYELYKAIRENPSIGLAYQLDDLKMQSEPPLSILEPVSPIVETPETEWSKKQWDYVQQIKAELLHYRKEHSKLLLELDKLHPISNTINNSNIIHSIKMDVTE